MMAEDFDRFPEDSIQLPAVLENDLADVPKSAIRSLRDHDNVTSTKQCKRAVASYLACSNYADADVGRVLEALDNGPSRDSRLSFCGLTTAGSSARNSNGASSLYPRQPGAQEAAQLGSAVSRTEETCAVTAGPAPASRRTE